MARMRLSCTLAEALEVVWEDVRTFHWGLEGTVVFDAAATGDLAPDDLEVVSFFEPLDRRAQEELAQRPFAIWDYAWLRPGVLLGLGKFIRGDWTNVAGFSKLPGPRKGAAVDDLAWLEQNADISFACVDAAFWEVATPHRELLDRLKPFLAT